MRIFSRRRSPKSMKRLYNWFHRYYGGIERFLDPVLDEVVQNKIASIENAAEMTAVDYACGSGMLTLKLVPVFKSVIGRDQSAGMLSRAKNRAMETGTDVRFEEGNILEIHDEDASVDYSFVSFALHLFPLETEIEILKNLLRISRRGVIIVDHSRKRDFGTAFIEWLEGSWYDQFIKTDFGAVAEQVGASGFEELEIGDCLVLTFRKNEQPCQTSVSGTSA